MIKIERGDLIALAPHTPLYPSAYSSPAAPTSGRDYTSALVIAAHDFYLNIILPSGTTAWIHNGSCRLARKADRT
jgi:hypothetical protein